MLYRRKRDFEAASAFFFEPTLGLIEPHLKGNTTHLNGKTPMARRNESPLLWQTQFLQKVVVALTWLPSRGLVQPTQRVDDRRVISGIVHTESGCVGLHP